MKKYQGGFSDSVFNSDNFQNYIKSSNVCGYIGSCNRSIERDTALEAQLKIAGLKSNGIASWLTSSTARHFMDNINDETTIEQFRERAIGYTEDAFIQVTIWNHPDHEGMLSDTIRLKKELKNRIKLEL